MTTPDTRTRALDDMMVTPGPGFPGGPFPPMHRVPIFSTMGRGPRGEKGEAGSLKFADPIEWDASNTYEAGVIVLGPNGTSYMSKKAVPANIGLDDTEYWGVTATPSAEIQQVKQQLQQYEQDIQQLEQDIEDIPAEILPITHDELGDEAVTSINIKDGAIGLIDLNDNVQKRMRNRNTRFSCVVFIGDSYGRGVGGADGQGWPYYCASFLGLPAAQYLNVSNSGAGFIATGHSGDLNGLTFSGQLDYAANHLPDSWRQNHISSGSAAEAVDLVVIAGGYNDHAQSGIPAAVITTVNHAKDLFPNACIAVIPLCVGDRELNGEFWGAYHRIVDGAMQAGAATTESGIYWLYPFEFTTSSGDHIHPNDTGYRVEGYNIASFLMGGTCEPYTTTMGASAEGFSVGSGTTNNGFRCGVSQGMAWLSGSFTRVGNNAPLCTLPSYLRPNNTVYFPAFAYADSTHHGIMRMRVTTNGVLEAYVLESGTWDASLTWTYYIYPMFVPLGHEWM